MARPFVTGHVRLGGVVIPPSVLPAFTVGRTLTVCLLLATAVAACGDGGESGSAAETMPERLERLAIEVNPIRNRFANTALVDAIAATPVPADPPGRFGRSLALAEQILYSGQLDEAVAMLTALRVELEAYDARVAEPERAPAAFTRAVTGLLAIAHLRRGERDNCLRGEGPAACAVPVPPDAVHEAPSGARDALAEYESLLSDSVDDYGARWMVNVAHMMLGTYPAEVPAPLLIPPGTLGTEGDVGRFPEVAAQLGLDEVGHVGGAVMDDFNGDGLLDLMATSWQLRDPVRYHLNRGDGSFERLTGRAGLEGLWGGGNIKQADYDNDGDLDAFILRGGWLPDGQPNSLIENLGDGTFTDVTRAAGLLDPERPSQTAVWLDYDGDGLLDLFVGNETFGPEPQPCQLFRNTGGGSFVDVADEVGANVVGIVKGVASGDYDNDGRPDLYLSRTGAPNVLLHNDGPDGNGGWRFSDRTARAGVAEPVDAFPTWFWDFDNDGWLDIYVAGYRTQFGDVAREYLGQAHSSELPRLYRNLGDGTFEDVTVRARLDRIQFAMGSNFGDLDNDGWLDFYIGTGDAYFEALVPNRMFRGRDGAEFEEVTASGGFGLLQKGHGVAFGDIDHDGDQDVFIALGGAYEGDLGRNALFENPGHGNSWISLRLQGSRNNRSAFGARVRVEVHDSAGESRRLHRVVSGGRCFGGNPLRLDIGLGRGSGTAAIRVEWPASGIVDTLDGLDVNNEYLVIEGSGEALRQPRETIRLGSGAR